MSQLLPYIAWVAFLVILLTGWAMLQDARKSPHEKTARGWVQHLCRLLVLDLMTAFAGVFVVFPSVWPATIWSTGPVVVLAMFVALASPCPWWRYVFQDAKHANKPATDLHPQL